MKYLLILLLLLSCGSRTKTKTTDKTEAKVDVNDKTKVETEHDTNIKAIIGFENKAKTQIETEVTTLQSIQNLSLKNSGKCVDAGQVRFLSFTDKNGSKLEVPVDNNTELNFGNESNFKQENQSLKSENESLKTENTSLSTRFKEVLNQNKTLSENVKVLQKSNHVESQRTSWTTWLWFGISLIMFWEIGKFIIKRKWS